MIYAPILRFSTHTLSGLPYTLFFRFYHVFLLFNQRIYTKYFAKTLDFAMPKANNPWGIRKRLLYQGRVSLVHGKKKLCHPKNRIIRFFRSIRILVEQYNL